MKTPKIEADVGKYKMNSVAELTGFSPNLLRAWERRYSILEPQRKSSGHRLYTDDDIKVLGVVKELIGEGRSIGEISALGRHRILEMSPQVVDLPAPPSLDESVAKDFQSQIVALAGKLDASGMDELLTDCFARYPREFVFYNIMVGALRELGALWIKGQGKVAHEHLASTMFSRYVLNAFYSAQKESSSEIKLLTACLPGEQHDLGALLVSYSLATTADVTYLGSLPFLDLEGACRELEPSWVLLSVARPALFELHSPRLGELIAQNSKIKFVLGGWGIDGFGNCVEAMGAFYWPSGRDLEGLKAMIRGTATPN